MGALDRNGRRSKFNACGRIDVYAPGEDIPLPSTQDTFWGTSFAAPAVGGLVSLLKQCAIRVGPPASHHIHQVEILRDIFQRHMVTKDAFINSMWENIDKMQIKFKTITRGTGHTSWWERTVLHSMETIV